MTPSQWGLFVLYAGFWGFIIARHLKYGGSTTPTHPLELVSMIANAGMALWWATMCMPIGVELAVVAAYQAWDLWRRRPPRNRRESKVLGRVRDMGHRLVVTNS